MYQVFAIADNRNGYVQDIERFQYLEDIEIHTEMFAHDIIITIAEDSVIPKGNSAGFLQLYLVPP